MNKSIPILLSKSKSVSVRLEAAKDTESELLKVFGNEKRRDRVLKHFERLLRTLSRVANDDDVGEASCRILGVLGSIPEYETEEYRIFMNWMNSVKENLSYLHVFVENFQKHGGKPGASLARFALRFTNQNVRSVVRLLCIHNSILEENKSESLDDVLKSTELNELKQSGNVDVESNLMRSYVVFERAVFEHEARVEYFVLFIDIRE